MSLIQKLKARAENNRPVRVGIIGAGKFGSMYLSQVPRTPGIHLVAIADLSPGLSGHRHGGVLARCHGE